MWAFEKLGQVPPNERHEVWTAKDLASREPLAAVKGNSGGVLYYEFLTDDARLTLANARSASADGAQVVTYAAATKIELEDGVDIGHVGSIETVNAEIVHVLCGAGTIPVIAPIATDSQGRTWNVNADTAAEKHLLSQ